MDWLAHFGIAAVLAALMAVAATPVIGLRGFALVKHRYRAGRR